MRVDGSSDDLSPELSKVMVGVQVAPAKPFLPRHGTKERVCRGQAGRGLAKPVENHDKHRPVPLEINWWGAADALFDFRPRFDAVRPRERAAECHPFHDCALKKSRRGAHSFFAQRSSVRVAEVADHLLDRHPAPSPLIGSRQRRDALRDGIAVSFRSESLHLAVRRLHVKDCFEREQNRDAHKHEQRHSRVRLAVHLRN